MFLIINNFAGIKLQFEMLKNYNELLNKTTKSPNNVPCRIKCKLLFFFLGIFGSGIRN